MSISALAQPFRALPLFRDLSPLQLTEIVRRADRVVYRPGDVIISENQVGDAAILIVSGEAVRINADNTGDLNERLPEGTLVGELAMLVETTHTTTVLARTMIKALRLGRDDMHDAMMADPEIAHHFSHALSDRLSAFASQISRVDHQLASVEDYFNIGHVTNQHNARQSAGSLSHQGARTLPSSGTHHNAPLH